MQVYDMEELEPRITPKPTAKFDHFAAPVVPEVSLIFDKPVEHAKRELDKSTPSIIAKQKSYAEWKEINFSWKAGKPASVDRFRSPTNQQNIQSCSTQYRESEYPLARPGSNIPATNQNSDNIREYRPRANLSREYDHEDRSYVRKSPNCPETRKNFKVQEHYTNTQHNQRAKNKEDVLSISMPNYPVKLHQNGKSLDNYALVQDTHTILPQSNTNNYNNNNTNVDFHNDPRIMYAQSNSEVNATANNPHVAFSHPCCETKTSSFPVIYPTNCFNNTIDNNETIKNLLQLVNNQSEQIKILQLQVDRLLKMQEESMKEKSKCSCSSQTMHQHQNKQMCIDSYNGINQTISQNKYVRNSVSQNGNVLEKNAENLSESKSRSQSEFNPQMRKTFMEQKVSIGVMTSFELMMQNSPFVLESEDTDKNDTQQNKIQTKQNEINLHDSSEPIRRNKNSFTCLQSAQLENIVEDSESYLSSSQQYSSNLNASSSTKDLQEKHNHTDTQKEVITRNLPKYPESPKDYIRTESPNMKRSDNQKYLQNMHNDDNVKKQEANITPILPINHPQYTVQERLNPKLNGTANKATTFTPFNAQKQRTAQKSAEYIDCCNSSISRKRSDNMKQSDCVDDSMVLARDDFKVDDRLPTPEPSIHVEMQEYSSDDESDKVKRTSKVGWTFYNNVLGQVNQILQESCPKDLEQKSIQPVNNVECNDTEKVILDSVKIATLEQLRKLGISLTEVTESREQMGNKKMGFDASYYPRLDYQANIAHSTVSETNTSLHMKALALKYLNDEQLAELAIQKQGAASVKQLMLSNMQGTNMSFATMRYLERYQLLPGRNNVQNEGIGKVVPELISKTDVNTGNVKHIPAMQRFPPVQTSRTTCPSKILDISTLKQQPKLL